MPHRGAGDGRSRAAALAVVCCLLVVCSTGCSMWGDGGMGEQSAHASNLALQRESALKFREDWPNMEKIRFTREGDRPGLGAPWSVNAVATFDGVDHQVIIGTGNVQAYLGGNLPPEPSTASVLKPLTIIYSDGTTEDVE